MNDFTEMANFINLEFKHIVINVEEWVIKSLEENKLKIDVIPNIFKNSDTDTRKAIDYIITLGGDGTILWASKQFHEHYVPPLISFSLGSLGYLCNFTFEEYKDVLKSTLCPKCRLHLDHRLRLKVTAESGMKKVYRGNNLSDSEQMMVQDFHIINEIVVDRGPSPYSI
jgi:NAD+ kinase